MSTPDDNFLGRWSRKKLEPEIEVAAEAPESKAALEDTLTDEEILEQLELPDPDSLKEGDDFSAFMQAAVPDHLRRKALRKLWTSNPALANLDGLLDYGDDFTDAAMVPEVLNTAYKVGRGILKEILEDDEPEDAPDTPDDELLAENLPEVETPQEPESPVQLSLAPEPVVKAPPRPRMVFTTS